MATTTPKKEPTTGEAMFFFSILKHTKSKPADVDWNAVAADQGFKNADVAKVRFGQIKRKLGLNTDSPSKRTSGGDASTPTKVKKTPVKRGPKTPKKPIYESDIDDDMRDEDSDEFMGSVKKEEGDM